MANPHPPHSFWYEYAEKFGAPDIKYCEETLAQFISEPANTWSNLLLIAVGFYLHMKRKQTNRLFNFYGMAVALMGLMSFLYHLSNNFLTQFIDFIGMYGTVGLIMLLNFKRLNILEEKNLKKIYYLSFLPFSLLILVLRHFSIPIQTSVTLMVFVIFATELIIYIKNVQPALSYVYMLAGLFFLVLATTSQLIDVNRLYCNSHNHVIQPHALWHIFNGVAFYFFYFYYDSADTLSTDVA